jgi:hypothetical protein
MWKIDPKDKCIHKWKHFLYTQIYNTNYMCYVNIIYVVFVIVGLFNGTGGRRRRHRVNKIELHRICVGRCHNETDGDLLNYRV